MVKVRREHNGSIEYLDVSPDVADKLEKLRFAVSHLKEPSYQEPEFKPFSQLRPAPVKKIVSEDAFGIALKQHLKNKNKPIKIPKKFVSKNTYKKMLPTKNNSLKQRLKKLLRL